MTIIMSQNNAINKLNEFMQKHKMKYIDPKDKTGSESEKPTHTSMGGQKGSYRIPDNKYEKFISLYKDAIKEGDDLYIVERNKDVGPLVVDIDYRTEHKGRQYTIEHIKDLTMRYITLIKKYFNITDIELTSLIFEKATPTKENKDGIKKYKDGFHIIFPEVVLSVKNRYFLYNMMLEEAQDDNPFKDIDIDEDCELDSIFDSSVIINNGLLMYKSHKEGREPYELTYAFDFEMNDINVDLYTLDEVVDMTLLRRCTDDDQLEYNSELNEDDIIDEVEENYQMYSNGKKNKNKKKVEQSTTDLPRSNISSTKTINKNGKEIHTSQEHIIRMAKRIVNELSPKRSREFHSWIRVGWALYNVDYSLLGSFKEFSKKCPKKYDESACDKVWNDACDKGLSMASLIWWVREDNKENPKIFDTIVADCASDHITRALTGTHDDVANAMFELYRDLYKCTNIKANSWYEFKGHRWDICEQGHSLFEKISDELAKTFLQISSAYIRLANDLTGPHGDMGSANANKSAKLCDNLKNVSFKEKLMIACRSKFYDRKFEEKLDSNIHLIGFDNGVYDLQLKQFRNGTPDDFIKMSTGYDYKLYDLKHPTVIKITEYFSKVQRDVKMREYTLRFISSCLDGSTKDQKFFIWTGTGANGKSTTEKLISHTLGDYFKTMPNEVMTRKSAGPGNATPELADKRGVRLIMMNEPEGSDTLGVSKMKEWSGGENIAARAPYGQLFYYKPQFKMVLACNKLPNIKARDDGTWRRMRVVAWGSKFTDNPKKDNEFKMDRDLMDNIAEWNSAFMWMLLHIYYPRYEKFGFEEPSEVTEHTKKYKKDSDFYFEFLNENTETIEGEKEDLPLLYDTFREWYREAYNEKAPNRKDFVEYLLQKEEFKLERNIVTGIKLLNNGDNEKENKK